MLEDEREDGEDAAEEIDGHEEERDAEDGSVLVDLVELGSLSRQTQHGRERNDGHGQVSHICLRCYYLLEDSQESH